MHSHSPRGASLRSNRPLPGGPLPGRSTRRPSGRSPLAAVAGRICVGALIAAALVACASSPASTNTGDAHIGERHGDFVARTVYLDDSGATMGVRWEHADNGMPVTVLRIQSVPQVFLYVNTPPVSDRGEPHTGEHLLLGKGRKGKQLSIAQGMSLIGSTAYTSQSDVVYAWNCSAGKQTFYDSISLYLDALLLPNYTDEEVRREVGHLGVKENAATGELQLEEKGTIYNEMVSAYEKRWILAREMGYRVWGNDHPNSWSSGGEPAAVRAMEPHHIHDFHAAHYHLSSNIGMIVALPDTVPEREFLAVLTETVERLEEDPELAARPKTLHTIPPADPQRDRGLRSVPFPSENEEVGGAAMWVWPPIVPRGRQERVLSEVLMNTLGDTPKGTLYKRLMDSSTRELEVGASEVFAWLDVTKVDVAPSVGFDGFPKRLATPEFAARITTLVQDEFRRVAELAPGSPELKAFNNQARVQLTAWEKNLRKSLNAPPLFGHRLSRGFWLDHLRLLALDSQEEQVVTLGPVFAAIRAQLADTSQNPWTDLIRHLGVLAEPYVGISVPSADELDARQAAQALRIVGHVERLKNEYGVADGQEALRRFREVYDAGTAELAALDEGLPQPHLVEDVALTLDPSIKLEHMTISANSGGAAAEGYRGVFDNVSFVETALYLDLETVRPQEYHWLPLLPSVLTGAGIIDAEGKPVPYDEADKRRSDEIYELSAEYSTRPSRNRYELRVSATGLDLQESGRAVGWIEEVLFFPWIDERNLPRLRDLVTERIQGTANELGGREEAWVNNPANAVRYQDDALYLSAESLHTAFFHLARLEWLLMDAPPPEHRHAVSSFLQSLSGLARPTLAETSEALSAAIDAAAPTTDGAGAWIRPLGARIRDLVPHMAPGSVAGDLRDLGWFASRDVVVEAADAVTQLRTVIDRMVLAPRKRARFVLTGNRRNTDLIAERLKLTYDQMVPQSASWDDGAFRPIRVRLQDHDALRTQPVHYALVHGGGTSGVFIHSADTPGLDALDRDTLVSEIAGRVFGGAGPHGFFMQTWGAGLAYSNGLGANAQSERIRYYAERCPDLTETMKFVTGLVRNADALNDPYLVEYAISTAVGATRESDRFEERTRAAAADMVDGDTPERIRRYRETLLSMRYVQDLWPAVKQQIKPSAGRVLPGVGPSTATVPGHSFLVIAPPKMIDTWEEYLRQVEGPDTHVFRIYGRDFWLVPGGSKRR